jgi:hypothetical protein
MITALQYKESGMQENKWDLQDITRASVSGTNQPEKVSHNFQ